MRCSSLYCRQAASFLLLAGVLVAPGCGTRSLRNAAALIRIGQELDGRVYYRTIPGLLVARQGDRGVVVASGYPLPRGARAAPEVLSVVFRSGEQHELALNATMELYDEGPLAVFTTESSDELPKSYKLRPSAGATGAVELYGFAPFDLLVPGSANPRLSCRARGEIEERGRLKLTEVVSNHRHALVCSASGRFLGLGTGLITADTIDMILRRSVLIEERGSLQDRVEK